MKQQGEGGSGDHETAAWFKLKFLEFMKKRGCSLQQMFNADITDFFVRSWLLGFTSPRIRRQPLGSGLLNMS